MDTNSAWLCTAPYNNTIYAKYACPYNTLVCGTQDTFALTQIGSTLSLSMTLARGDVCFYKITNNCGIVQFNVTSNNNSDNFLIEFIEYEKGLLLQGSSSDLFHGKHGGAPALGMPWRTETFVYDDNHKVYQGKYWIGQGIHYWGSYTQNI